MTETNRHERSKVDRRAIWWDGASLAHTAGAGIIAIALLLLLLGLQFLSDAALLADYTSAYTDHQTFGITVVSVAGMAAWSFSVSVRCSDAAVRRYVTIISLLLIFWLLVVIIKYPATNDRFIEFCWYLYYIPFEAVPLLLFFVGLRTAALERYPIVGKIKVAAVVITVFLVFLVLTNGLHHMVFMFDINDPNWDGNYSYGTGYWLVVGWGVLMCALFVGSLFSASRANLRGAFLVLAMLAIVALSYSALYILRVEWAFGSKIALNYSIFFVLVIELCLDLGILPSCAWLHDAFAALPLDMKIVDCKADVAFATSSSRPFEGEVIDVAESRLGAPEGSVETVASRDRKSLYTTYSIDDSVAIVTKDVSLLVEKRAEFQRRSYTLRRRNDILERQASIRALMAKRSRERELLAEAEASISSALSLAQELLACEPADDTERDRILQRVKLIMFYCKRKGALALNEKAEDEFERDRLLLVMTEAASELRDAGVYSAAVVDIAEPLPARTVSLFYDCFYGVSKLGLLGDDAVLMACISQRAGARAEMTCNLEGRIEGDPRFGTELESLRLFLSERGATFELKLSSEGVWLFVSDEALGGGAR